MAILGDTKATKLDVLGDITKNGVQVACTYLRAGSPVNNITGNPVPAICIDTTNSIIYYSVTSGTWLPLSAVWG